MTFIKKMCLQLFADGGDGGSGSGSAGAVGGESGAAVETAADDGQPTVADKLRALGVPESKIRKKAKSTAAKSTTATAEAPAAEDNAQVAAAPENGDNNTAPSRMTWDEIMADPEYNKEAQRMMRARIAKSKSSEDAMQKLAPALDVLANYYGIDVDNPDYDKLAEAIKGEDKFFEDKALELGTDANTARDIVAKELNDKRVAKEQRQTVEMQRIEQHFNKLEQQAETMKQTFPSFDLREELKNPAFARMTSPNVNLSVEDAYYAVHRKEIQAASMQATARIAADKVANSVRSGINRPQESGSSGQAPTVTSFNYRSASKEQREALKREIRNAAARKEKIYPGQI